MADEIRYHCQRCTACCRWPGLVKMGIGEIAPIAAHLGLSAHEFIQRSTRLRPARDGLALIDQGPEASGGYNHACIFLQGRDCAVQPVKPRQCAGFPNTWNFPGWREVCEAAPGAGWRRLLIITSRPAPARNGGLALWRRADDNEPSAKAHCASPTSMLKLILPCALILALAGCSAPQGKKLAASGALAPVAAGPPAKAATLTLKDSGQFVNLYPAATVTVKLPARGSNGIEWRFSEIPDPTVLQLVSNDCIPASSPTEMGEQTLVFHATAPGDVRVRMWYGTLWASPMEARIFDFIAAVNEQEKPPKKSAKKKKAKKRAT